MKIRLFNAAEIRRLLPMAECIEVMARALATLAGGDAVQPLRTAMWLPDRRGLVGMMPGYLGDIDRAGIKVLTVFPGNHGTPYDSHQGVVLLFESGHGSPLAILDASEVTAIRTAAVSGVATRLLAAEGAAELAILGTGVQARTHLEAMRAVRPIRRVRVWSRDAANVERFVARSRETGVAVEGVGSAEAAVAVAEIVCTTTAASEPVLAGEWLAPGCHVNAVGASLPTARELDSAAVARSRLFVDRRESALNEAGDFLIARREGAVGDDHIVAELGELLTGDHPGRESAEEITLFKSLGLGIEDVAAAEHVYRQGIETGTGIELELGGGDD